MPLARSACSAVMVMSVLRLVRMLQTGRELYTEVLPGASSSGTRSAGRGSCTSAAGDSTLLPILIQAHSILGCLKMAFATPAGTGCLCQGFQGTALCCVHEVPCIWIGPACVGTTHVGFAVAPLIPWLGQTGFPHQIAITLPGRAPALVDRPYHQALSAPHVSCRKDTGHVRGELPVFGLGV